MLNLICGLIGLTLFCLFVGGLAVSIGSIAFGIIAITVIAMAGIEFVENLRSSKNNKEPLVGDVGP